MRLSIAGCLIMAVVAPLFAGTETTLDNILARNAEALGGNAAFEAIENVRFRLDIREPTFEVTGTYVASRAGEMRIDIEADGQRVFAEGLDDGVGWQWSPDGGVTLAGEAGAASLRNGIEAPGRFWTLQQLRARGAHIELLEPGPLARPNEWQLRLTRQDGLVVDYLVDRASYLVTREVSRRAFHPDAAPTEVQLETVRSEPVTVDGVLRFGREEQHNLETGEWLGTTVVREVAHNIDLPEGYFAESVACHDVEW